MGMPSVAIGQPQQQRPRKSFKDSGFANVLGQLGDALLVSSGRAPMYAPQKARREEMARREQTGAALANYLGNLDPAIAELIRSDPAVGMEVFKATRPKAPDKPSFVEEYEYRQGLDPTARGEFDSYAERRKFNPFAAPITMEQGDVLEEGGAPSEVTATGPNGEKVRLNPQSGQWEPVGGQTETPSGNFP